MTALRHSERLGQIDGLAIVRSEVAGLPAALNHIDGRWRPGASGSWLRVTSPSSGVIAGSATLSMAADIEAAVQAARAAQPGFAALALRERADLCRKIAGSILLRSEALARLLSIEQGKPLLEARSEVQATANGFRAAAEEVASACADDVLCRDGARVRLSRRRPRGVVGLLAAANYPLGGPSTACLGPALATGNAVVWVPAATTPLASAALVECMLSAGLPPGVVNLVVGDQADLAPAFVRHPGIAGVSQFDNRASAHALARLSDGRTIGGGDGGTSLAVVMFDADIEAAAEAIARRGFDNAGQIGAFGTRVLVHASIQPRLLEALAAAAAHRRLGDGFDPATTLGPLNNRSALALLERQIADAQRRGGRFVAGGNRIESETGLHVAAGVMTAVDGRSFLNREGSQGPVIPVLGFRNESEFADIARAGPLGPSIAVFTRSVDAADDLARSVGAETVTVNEVRSVLDDWLPCSGTVGDDRGTRATLLAMTARITLSVPVKAIRSSGPSMRREGAVRARSLPPEVQGSNPA